MRLRSLIVAVLSAFLGLMAAANAFAADKRFYDSQGRYQGRQDASGRYYALKVGIKERWTPTDVITTPGDATKAGKTATAATMTRKAATKANRTLGGATTIRRDATKGGAMPTAVTTTRRAVIRDAISKLGRCDQSPAFSSSVHSQ